MSTISLVRAALTAPPALIAMAERTDDVTIWPRTRAAAAKSSVAEAESAGSSRQIRVTRRRSPPSRLIDV
ncbi:MAG: hypothetical protein L0I76_15450 [Pseudonocardia sp.]|nr:hypothetical protein [Pseudonocardia sp.]